MENTKPIYLSKTVIAQVIAVICLWLNVSGIISIDEAAQGSIVDVIMSAVLVVSQVVAIYSRIIATDKLS